MGFFPPSHLQSCCRRLYNWLKVSPYRPDQQLEEDDDLMDESQGKGIRVLGVAYAPSRYAPTRQTLAQPSTLHSNHRNLNFTPTPAALAAVRATAVDGP